MLAATGNMLIEALAGTGKSTVLVQLVRIYNKLMGLTVLCLAFANRDKNTLAGKVCGRAKVWTSSGAGTSLMGAWCRQQGRALEHNPDVSSQILESRFIADGLIVPDADHTPDKSKGERQRRKWNVGVHVFTAIKSVVEKTMTCVPMSAMGHDGLPSRPTDDMLMDIAAQFDIEISTDDMQQVLFYSQCLFTEMANIRNVLVYGCDFTQQVFLPVYHNLKAATTYDVVMIDELQDQSYYNRMLAMKFIRPNTGRIVAVGDRNQGIYSWRGADRFAMDEMEKLMTKLGGMPPAKFPLTLCRRCAKSIIRTAQTLVPSIQALPDAPEGEVANITDSAALFDALSAERKGLVLCRMNAPLISMCLKLLAKRIPAALTRSNIVADLLRLVDQLSGRSDSMPVTEVLAALTDWATDRLAKLAKRRNGASAAQVVADKVACVQALCEEESIKTAGNIKRKINEIFPADVELSPNNLVLFSTVHGAKGGEADTVYLYSPDTLKVNVFDQVWSDAVDRDNTLYVAITRAERRLFFVGGVPSLCRFSEGADLDDTDLADMMDDAA